MNKFLFRLAPFLMLLTLSIACLYYFNQAFLSRKDNFVLKNNPHTIFIGNSRAECSFNDSIISGSKNLGFSAEPYFYSYFKLKQLLESNKISTVFLEFSNWQVSQSIEKNIWGDYYVMRNCKTYQPWLGFEELKTLFKKNPRKLITVQPVVIKAQLEAMIAPSSEFFNHMDWGAYLHIPYSHVDSLLDVQKKNSNSRNELNQAYSSINLSYFDKIIALCQEKNVKIHLVRAPIHPQSGHLSNEKQFQDLLKERYSHLRFFDFKDFPVTNDEMGDLEHLNSKGALKFSLWFQEAISRNYFDQPAN